VTLLIDDLGFDDLRSHDLAPWSKPITPHAEQLMREGVRLNRHHTYMWCSPTRRSFMTGRYPVHITGMQAEINTNLTPLQFTILGEKLAAAEYESHFVGKGHMGWHTTDHLLVN
jgi:arylsulfatase A-like enzyme